MNNYDVENGDVIIKKSFCNKCFNFWVYKHPFCFLWLFIILMFLMALVISELNK